MWTAQNRGCYDRSRLRYPSDLTDEEWAYVAPQIPAAKRGGNKRHVDVREVMNGILYALSTCCQWRAIPKDLPPRSTVYDHFELWSWDGTLERIHHALYVTCRDREEREGSPSAATIDSQSVKRAEKVGAHRSVWLRCGKKDQRQEAPHSRRYTRPSVERRCSSCRCPGPRWGGVRSRRTYARTVSVHPGHLRRCRLPGATRRIGSNAKRRLGHRNRQAQ